MFYKNVSYTEKTFYGVTFKPGEIKNVPKYINNKWLIRLDDYAASKDSLSQQKPSSDKNKKESIKSEKVDKPEVVVNQPKAESTISDDKPNKS